MKRPFYKFDAEADKVWAALWKRQYPECQKYAHSMWKDGLKELNLPYDRVPDFAEMNKLFQDKVGWSLVSTDVQYSSGQDWFEALARKEFLITEYIRTMDVLDYTPLPDIWHDTFGHLPYMIIPEYAEYIHDWALKAIEFAPEARKGMGSIWWYAIEFGLMKDAGETKAFGAGLMSGYTELQRVMHGTVNAKPFDMNKVTNIPPSPHNYHEEMFIFEDFQQLRDILNGWYEHHKAERIMA
jgi:phenylalanine-4-hydroxylase